MGGGVAAELAAHHFPMCAVVNERSFSCLGDVAFAFVGRLLGVGRRPMLRRVTTTVLALAFSHRPWALPLDTATNWRSLPAGRKLLVYHADDHVIGHEAALHTVLEAAGEGPGGLDGTDVIELGGEPDDPHN